MYQRAQIKGCFSKQLISRMCGLTVDIFCLHFNVKDLQAENTLNDQFEMYIQWSGQVT